MELYVAKSAGFCMGVASAVRTVYEKMNEQPLLTYGSLTHNRTVTDDLARKGVSIIDNLDEVKNETVVIRSHGVPPELEEEMKQRGIPYIDCTCRCVKAVHRHAQKSREEGREVIILGKAEHPEIIGTIGYAGDANRVISDENDIPADLDTTKQYALVAQTTFERERFNRIVSALQRRGLDIRVYDTICEATSKRQAEAASLSKKVDLMIVLGDKNSANTTELYNICKKNCPQTVLIESIHDLQLQFLSANVKIGVTAGASTPPAITKEAISFMRELENVEQAEQTENRQQEEQTGTSGQPELQTVAETAEQPEPSAETEGEEAANQTQSAQTFEEMLNESFITLHTGDVVKGTVIHVSSGEVTVNLGYKSDGIITKSELTDDSSADLTQLVKPGDVFDVYVMRVNDGDGNVLVSKRKLDAQTNYKLIEQAFNSKTPVAGKVMDVVKGGLIASVFGNRVFVPSSQISNRYVEDLTVFKGKEFNFNILEFDRSKRRIVAGRKELAAIELQQRREELFSSLEVGQRIEGTVSRIVDFGAFVDLGGVDGLIHISELAWRRVRKVADVLKVGDPVTVTVIDVNPEKNKISLSLKDIHNNPWSNIAEKYPIGSIVEGQVVRMAVFGAFVTLEDGVDGLVHISQIANRHIAKPDEELSIGDIISVKVTDIDEVNKKISLSKKDADNELDAQYDESADDLYEDEMPEDDTEEEASEPADE